MMMDVADIGILLDYQPSPQKEGDNFEGLIKMRQATPPGSGSSEQSS
jgi:hypothetical protein